MSDMFCFQCQQTAGNKCCVSVGVCGKQPDTAALQDELVYELIRLAEAAAAAGQRTQIVDRLLMDGLFITLTNVNFDNQAIAEFTERVRAEREKFGGKPCAVVELWKGTGREVQDIPGVLAVFAERRKDSFGPYVRLMSVTLN